MLQFAKNLKPTWEISKLNFPSSSSLLRKYEKLKRKQCYTNFVSITFFSLCRHNKQNVQNLIHIYKKNKPRRSIWRTKLSSPNNSSNHPILSSIASLLWPSTFSSLVTLDNISLHLWNTRRFVEDSSFFVDLVSSFRAWHTKTLGCQISHLEIHQVLLEITRLSFLDFFSLFCSFNPIRVIYFFFNPYTKKSRL